MLESGVGAVHVQKVRGELVIYQKGRTPRGQAFIKDTTVLKVPSMASPEFKSAVKAALE